MIFGKLICWYKGHRRGKRTNVIMQPSEDRVIVCYQCTRCGALWQRNAPKRKAKK